MHKRYYRVCNLFGVSYIKSVLVEQISIAGKYNINIILHAFNSCMLVALAVNVFVRTDARHFQI